MDRIKDLEHHIEESYLLISQYEGLIRTTVEPEAKLRWDHRRGEQWILVQGYIEEYVRLLRGRRMPEPIMQIAAHFPEFYYGDSPSQVLASNVRSWLEALGFSVASEVFQAEHFVDLLVNIHIDVPLIGSVIQQLLVRCLEGEVRLSDVRNLLQKIKESKFGRGQIITNRRVTPAARNHANDGGLVQVMTFDELIDTTVRFDKYFEWLENEVRIKGIDTHYVDLACRKTEIDPDTQEEIAVSVYSEDEGWIDGYVYRWLDDPSKEHLSILGEFGSGKTWFSFHYAYCMLKEYRQAVRNGVERPRIPILIRLGEYPQIGDLKSLLSNFFFEKYDISLPNYLAIEQLNRMGKLFLIFDGFDEMAQRLDYHKVVRQFWELAKVVVPNSKALLTCRTEYFRYAREGRQVLGGEIEATSREDLLLPPRFEVLELEPLQEKQIRRIMSYYADSGTVEEILSEPHLSDLAKRPILIELLLEALPGLTPDIPKNIAQIYQHAINSKLERDVLEERTFTSQDDKLFFMTELAWEMFLRDTNKISYRQIPDRISDYFNVSTSNDINAYDYDLRTQSLFVRDENGDYEFAHKSIQEFFVARKLVGEIQSSEFRGLHEEIASTEIFTFVRQLISYEEMFSLLQRLPGIDGEMLRFNIYHILGGFSPRDFHNLDIKGVVGHLLDTEKYPYAKYRLLYWTMVNFDDEIFQVQAEQLLRNERDKLAKYAKTTWLRYYGGSKGLTKVLKERMFHPVYSRLTPLIFLLLFEEIGNPDIADWLEENLDRISARFIPEVQRTIETLRNSRDQSS